MLVITGIFENERFIPDKPVEIPQKKRVMVTIEDEKPRFDHLVGIFSDGKMSVDKFLQEKRREMELET